MAACLTVWLPMTPGFIELNLAPLTTFPTGRAVTASNPPRETYLSALENVMSCTPNAPKGSRPGRADRVGGCTPFGWV